ncbi:hypothetical protein B0T24DRAFT_594581 [Lasiosphaeria ovina]|uniref:Ankyrin repeat protein n=1 Tax=Lasiosphaeria ovina TaxID=92902 RepID=A0AAE0KDA9_9PEZI|nr:hypothetical protein B0T24DRAFT_594581 [Lasiosphaeria ovina]
MCRRHPPADGPDHIKLLHPLASAIRDAPKHLDAIRTEITSLEAIVRVLDLTHAQLALPATHNGPSVPLDACRLPLKELSELLEYRQIFPSSNARSQSQSQSQNGPPPAKRGRLLPTLTSLAWPLKENRAKAIMADISRPNQTLTLFLAADNFRFTRLELSANLQTLQATIEVRSWTSAPSVEALPPKTASLRPFSYYYAMALCRQEVGDACLHCLTPRRRGGGCSDKTAHRFTPFLRAVHSKNFSLALALLRSGARRCGFLEAIPWGREQDFSLSGEDFRHLLLELTGMGFSLNEKNQEGETILHGLTSLKVGDRMASMMGWAMKHGGDASLANSRGDTPLHIILGDWGAK